MAASDAEARVAAAAGLILDGYLANESGHESAVYVDDLGLPDHKPVRTAGTIADRLFSS